MLPDHDESMVSPAQLSAFEPLLQLLLCHPCDGTWALGIAVNNIYAHRYCPIALGTGLIPKHQDSGEKIDASVVPRLNHVALEDGLGIGAKGVLHVVVLAKPANSRNCSETTFQGLGEQQICGFLCL